MRSLLFLICCLAFCAAARAELKSYVIPDHDSLQLDIPPEWRDTFLPASGFSSRYPAVKLADKKSDTFQANISLIPNDAANPDFSSPEKVKQRAEVTGNHVI